MKKITLAACSAQFKNKSKKPDEIIFVDAKSTDNTPKILKEFKKNTKIPVRIISKNLNRSQGRNLAIKKAKYSIIASTDAGCLLDKYWLKRITKKIIQDKADAVAGFYLCITPTHFEKAVSPFVAVMPDEFNPDTFLPSSRSVAFTKQAWKKVGGYNSKLNYCEDLDFAHKIKQNTRMFSEKHALVYWHVASSYSQFFHQIKNYAKGDIQAKYYPHIKKIISIYLRYLIFIIFPPLFAVYIIWAFIKHYKYINHLCCLVFTPALQLTSDFAIMIGSFQAFVEQKTKATHP
jgi:glycosyltransferase involved in cell wall biosynthesis